VYERAAPTRGEGVLPECAFDRHEPGRGKIRTRPRTDRNPLDRLEHLLRVTRRSITKGDAYDDR